MLSGATLFLRNLELSLHVSPRIRKPCRAWVGHIALPRMWREQPSSLRSAPGTSRCHAPSPPSHALELSGPRTRQSTLWWFESWFCISCMSQRADRTRPWA